MDRAKNQLADIKIPSVLLFAHVSKWPDNLLPHVTDTETECRSINQALVGITKKQLTTKKHRSVYITVFRHSHSCPYLLQPYKFVSWFLILTSISMANMLKIYLGEKKEKYNVAPIINIIKTIWVSII